MRKMCVLIMAVLLLSGCSPTICEMSDSAIYSSIDSVSQTESKDAKDETVTSKGNTESATIPDRDDNTTLAPEATENRAEESQRETTAKETLPSQSSGSSNSVVSNNSNVSDSSQNVTIPQKMDTPTVTTSERAGKEDSLEVANRVFYYINEFRDEPATYLQDLAEYARYRSRQLISNFAHDTADQRAAATALQYGEYIDPSIFGGNGQPYYRANAREAIAKAGYVGTVDDVAYKLASLVKNSPNHWNYIGSSEYTNIAVGVTCESDMWYCAIEVATQNTDLLQK